jgi:hypothetical protein
LRSRLTCRKVKKLERAEGKESMMCFSVRTTQVARLLAHVTGMVNQQLLLQNEYLLAENRILRAICLPSSVDRSGTLPLISKRLGRRGLETVAAAANPDTILAWFRKLVAQKFDGSQHLLYTGRPTTGRDHGTDRPQAT